MISKKGKCSGCETENIYIVNRKHNLCQKCNYIRLHGSDALEKKQKKYQDSLGKVKNSSKLKQKSSKQNEIDKTYKQVCIKLIEEAKEQGTYFCRGCGNPNSLSCSHLVRRSRDRSLVATKENITFHCLVRQDGSRGCHDRWETISEMSELDDFDENMTMVRRLDPELYFILIGKMRDMGLDIDTNIHKNL